MEHEHLKQQLLNEPQPEYDISFLLLFDKRAQQSEIDSEVLGKVQPIHGGGARDQDLTKEPIFPEIH